MPRPLVWAQRAPALVSFARCLDRAVNINCGRVGDLRQGFFARRVIDGEGVALGRRDPAVVDEEIEMATARVQPGVCAASDSGAGP